MWIWALIALTLFGTGIQLDNSLARIGLFILASAAYRYWDGTRTCKHCKRKAHK